MAGRMKQFFETLLTTTLCPHARLVGRCMDCAQAVIEAQQQRTAADAAYIEALEDALERATHNSGETMIKQKAEENVNIEQAQPQGLEEPICTEAEIAELCNRLISPGDVKDNAGPAMPVRLGMYLNLAEELITQDNRGTSYPMFVVRDQRWDRCDDSDADRFVWTNNGYRVEDPQLLEELERQRKNHPDFEGKLEIDYETYRHQGERKTTEYVTTCLTQVGADAFIRENRHNLHDPYVYVASGYRNREWQMVRRMLLKLGGKDFSTRE